MLIPNSGGMLAGLPRTARAALMASFSTNVKFVRLKPDRAGLSALVELLRAGDLRVVIDRVYPIDQAANAVAHMLGHHASGKVAIAI